jgi:hypothetical protein
VVGAPTVDHRTPSGRGGAAGAGSLAVTRRQGQSGENHRGRVYPPGNLRGIRIHRSGRSLMRGWRQRRAATFRRRWRFPAMYDGLVGSCCMGRISGRCLAEGAHRGVAVSGSA